MAAVVVLVAKKEFAGQSPTEIPEETPLDEWLEANFDLVGPLSDDSAEEFTEAMREADQDRFWAILPLKSANTRPGLI